MKAFIFDLDGVLTDTAEYHYLAWRTLAERLHLKFNRKDNEQLKGVSRIRSLEIILKINGKEKAFSEEEKTRIVKEKNDIYVQLIQKVNSKDVLPNIDLFLEAAKKRGLKLAVASASKNAKTVLNGLGLAEKFDYIADAAKIKYTKPNPEVFLDCAKNLGVSPRDCIGFEDAQAGIEAIHSAGMYAVGIGVDVVTEKPDLELYSTEQLDIEYILKMAEKSDAQQKDRW